MSTVSKARIELVGGPGCGRDQHVKLDGGRLPEQLPVLGSRYRRSGQLHPTGRHIFVWMAERPPALLRATCQQHDPPRPGCPGYRPATKPP